MKKINKDTKPSLTAHQKTIGLVCAIILILYASISYDRAQPSKSNGQMIEILNKIKDILNSSATIVKTVVALKRDGTLHELQMLNSVSTNTKYGIIVRLPDHRGTVPVFCGQTVETIIHESSDSSIALNSKYNIKTGQMTQIPIWGYLPQLFIEDRAQIFIPHNNNESKRYEISILDAKPILELPPFERMILDKGEGNIITCGSIVNVDYTITDLDGNMMHDIKAEYLEIGNIETPLLLQNTILQLRKNGTAKIITKANTMFGAMFANEEVVHSYAWLNALKIDKDQYIVINIKLNISSEDNLSK